MHYLHILHDFVATYGYLAVFLVVAGESAGIPMPGETTLVAAAIVAGHGSLDIGLVIACGALGAIVGDNIGYWAGREFGFPLLLRYGRFVWLDEGRLKLGQYLFLRHGGKIVFFGRFVALLRAFAAVLAGVNNLSWPRFLLYNALGGVVWASVFGIGGYMLGRAFELYARPVGLAILVATIVGAVVGHRYVSQREKALIAEAEAALPGPLIAPRRRAGVGR